MTDRVIVERPECGAERAGTEHTHFCGRREGHYDDHICAGYFDGDCDMDWP